MTAAGPSPALRWTPDLCAPARFLGASCDRCVTACPRAALGRVAGGIAPGAGDCDGCGLCVPACPTGALEVSALPRSVLASKLAMASAAERPVVVRCERAAASRSAVGVPCVGLLDETTLVEALLRDGAAGVTLQTGDCGACPRGAALERVFPGTLRAARGLLASTGRSTELIRVDAVPDAEAGHVNTARRGLFRTLLGGLSQTVAPPPTGPIPSRRERLLRLLRSSSPKLHPATLDALPAAKPEIGDGCWGCTVCEHACPTRAIRRTETSREVVLEIDADSCVACAACAESCGPQAITYRAPAPIRRPIEGGMQEAARLAVRACVHCGESFAGRRDALACPGCRRRAPVTAGGG